MIRRLATRRRPIRAASLALLYAVLTFLALVGGWAGLNAWPKAAPRLAEPGAGPELPAATQETPRGPLPPLRRTVEAGFAPRGPRPEQPVDLTLDGPAAGEPLSVTLLDATTNAPLAVRALDAATTQVLIDGVPDVPLVAALHRPSASPRFAWLTRVEVPAATGDAKRRATLSRALHPLAVRLIAEDVAPDQRPRVVALALSRRDAPEWGAGAALPFEAVFQDGAHEVEVALGPLGPGRYALVLCGFATPSGGPVHFDLPGPARIEVRGQPQDPTRSMLPERTR